VGVIKAKALLTYRRLHCDMGDGGKHKVEAWGFWNWDVKVKSAFGD